MTRNGKRRGEIERLAYSPGELARALGISKTYAYSLLRAGRIRSIRVGSRWLIPVREVEAFLKSKGAEEGRDAIRRAEELERFIGSLQEEDAGASEAPEAKSNGHQPANKSAST